MRELRKSATQTSVKNIIAGRGVSKCKERSVSGKKVQGVWCSWRKVRKKETGKIRVRVTIVKTELGPE